MLSDLKAALASQPSVDAASWAADWADPILQSLLATGRYKTEASATVTRSQLKIAVIALTNGFKPEADEVALQTFVTRVRPLLAQADLIEAQAGRPRETAADRVPREDEKRRREETAAVYYLVNASDGDELVEDLKRFVANWEARPMGFYGHLAHLNVLIDAGLDRSLSFKRLMIWVKQRRAERRVAERRPSS
jgi:hypothetical protein